MIYLDNSKTEVKSLQLDRWYYENGIRETIEEYFARNNSWRKAKEFSSKIASKVTDRFLEYTRFPDNNGVYYPHGLFLWKHDEKCNIWKPTCIQCCNAMILADNEFWERLRNELNISQDLSGEIHRCIRNLDEVLTRTYIWDEYEEPVDFSNESFVFSKVSFVLSDNFYEKIIDEIEPEIREILFGRYVVEKDFEIVEGNAYAIIEDGEKILVRTDAFKKIYNLLKKLVGTKKARQFVVELKNVIFFDSPCSQLMLTRIEDDIPWAKYYDEDVKMQNNTWYIRANEQLMSEIGEKMQKVTSTKDKWISFTNVKLENGMRILVLIMNNCLWLGRPSFEKARHYPLYFKYRMLDSDEVCYEECNDELWIALDYYERETSFENYKKLKNTK